MLFPSIALAATLSATHVEAPHGRYVEARTSTVFAGACHFGAQATTQGREALLAWRCDGGRFGGVDLAGVHIAALVRGDENLANASAPRQSWIYVSDRVRPSVAEAAVAWLRAEHRDALGDVQDVRVAPLAVDVGADAYTVAAPGVFELAGAPLPDRACCAMPLQVWYRPFAAIEDVVVGFDREFRVNERAAGVRFSRPDENAAFTGRFGTPAPRPAGR